MKIENCPPAGEAGKLKIGQRGFTLVELLVVVAIIGILAAALLVGINPLEQTRKAQDAGKLSRCKEVISAAQRYYAFHANEANPEPGTCAALVTAAELKSGSCGTGATAVTLAGRGTTTYTCTFTATSQNYITKCGSTTCTVPTNF